MAVFSRILKNLGAMITGRAVTIIQQVIVAPVFVSRYSLAQFGEWGVLSGAVAAVGLLDFGVQTYMNQDLAVRYGREGTSNYHVHQSTALRLLLGLIFTGTILSLVVFALPLESMLKLDLTRHAAQLTAYLLAVQILLNILSGYVGGIFMVVRLAHRGAHWNNFQAMLTSLALLLCVSLHLPFPVLAGVQVLTMSITIVAMLIDFRRTAPQIFPTLRYWDGTAVKQMLHPSGYFGLLSLCLFLTYQAPLILLQRMVGPVAVASFIVMRTVFSMCRHVLAIFTHSMGAEITNLFAHDDWPALALLYDYSERFICFLIPIVNNAVLVGSPVIITVWLHKQSQLFSPYPYALAAAISMVISLKEHKYQFQLCTNTHEELARIMFASYVVMIIVSVGAVRALGVAGFLWTWLAVECVQMVWIVRLNAKLFSRHEPLESTYLRRLVAFGAATLLASVALLHRTVSLPLVWQTAIATLVALLLAGISWLLFHVTGIFRRVTAQFSRPPA
jgi:O-antigen/teichoic acid export membrane protein